MKEIYCSDASKIIVDDEDFDFINQFKWNMNRCYATRTDSNRKTIFLHKEIGKRIGLNINKITDHIDCNPLNCQRNNLREATDSESSMNRRTRIDNTSGQKGVTYHSRDRIWEVRIGIDGIRLHIGNYKNYEEACEAYYIAAKRYHKEFARIK